MSNLSVSCYAMFSWYSWETCSFLKEEGRTVELGDGEGGATRKSGGRGGTYCVSEEMIF